MASSTSSRIGLALASVVTVAAVLTGGSAATAAPDTCASPTATYTHNGSPYNLVGSGGEVDTGQCIVIDASDGPVVLSAASTGFIVDGGSIETINTSDTNTVTFTSDGQAWAGLVTPSNTLGQYLEESPLIDLENTIVVGGGVSVYGDAITLTDDTFGSAVCLAGGSASVLGSTITSAVGCGGPLQQFPNSALATNTQPGPTVVESTSLHITADNVGGMQLYAPGGTSSPPYPTVANVQASDDEVDGVSEASAAINVSGVFDVGTVDGISNNSGFNDQVPAIGLLGNSLVGFTVPKVTLTNTATAQPLVMSGDVTVPQGDVTVEAGASVYLDLFLADGTLTATTSPTAFYGTQQEGDGDSQPCASCDAFVKASRVTISGAVINGPLTVTGSAASSLINSEVTGSIQNVSPFTVADSVLGDGISHDGGSAPTLSVTGSRIVGASGWGVDSSGGALTASCDVVSGNDGGLQVGAGSSVLTSDLVGNTASANPDLKVDASVATPVNAETDWWGQASGPTTGQVQGSADTTLPSATTSACADADAVAPAVATNITVAKADGTVNLTWANPGDETLESVEVRMSPGDVAPGTRLVGSQIYAGTGTSASITGLTVGKDYSFTVFTTAADAVAPGVDSVTVKVAGPSPVTHFGAVGGYGTATLSWNPSSDPGTHTVICDEDGATSLGPDRCAQAYNGTADTTTLSNIPSSVIWEAFAVDNAGNVSSSATTGVSTPELQLRASSRGAATAHHGQRSTLAGTWINQVGSASSTPHVFKLYRSIAGAPYKLILTKTEPENNIAFTVRPTRSARYEFVAPPIGAQLAATSNHLLVQVQRKIVVHQPKAVRHGHARTLTGTVTPSVGANAITVDQYADGNVVGEPLGHASITGGGHFSFVVTPSKRGTTSYVVTTRKTSQFGLSESAVVTLRAT